ncbi:MAG: aminoglycoside phosphotransferase family protein [Deltaproteobacteria bacterium]|nr:aminoglycoside phosphotransferase family protein [Deltaproteobacteria bacterium]
MARPYGTVDPALDPVLSAFGVSPDRVEKVPTGLINATYRIQRGPEVWALQRVNGIFSPLVHEDIDSVTQHLAQKGVTTPRLRPALDGKLWIERTDEPHAGVWRMLTWIDGRNIDKLADPAEAREAGVMLGRFHAALGDLEWSFRARRLGVHDTPRHLTALRSALEAHSAHRLHAQVAALAQTLFDSIATLPPLQGLPERVVHGDPKITNIMFSHSGPRAIALVDLDTVAPMPLPLELGDAFRSWCNPAGEDATRVSFDLDLFQPAIEGYAQATRGLLEPHEVAAIAPAIGTIMLELSARFAADALQESYFGWNPNRYATRGDHNLLRARGQLALGLDFLAKRPDADAITRRIYR